MQKYRFADFELDLDALQLRLRGEPVKLERRPLDLLILLVSRHGQLVAREDIVAALWPTRVIIDFDSGLNTLVRKVRNALGDSSDAPSFIETVPGRGYRFIATLAPESAPAPAAPQTAQARATAAVGWRPVAALLLLLLVIGGTVFVWRANHRLPAQTRIAVLPFQNLTGDAGLGYLASGLAEETSMSLSRIDLPNLHVIGGVSARALANSVLSVPEIGRELGADFVVLSSLRLDRTRIRVTSRLIRITDSEQLWAASFDRELTNVLGLQRELSIAIAEQIRQRLSPDVAAAIDRRQTQNPEAYQLYLKGRYEWTRFLPDSVPRAIEYYRQAVAEDPGYALAWAGIAHALITSTVTVEAQPEAIQQSAQDALQHALEFGPDLAETQLALGSFHGFLDRDWPSAEAPARQAVALDPNSAMAHMFLGIVLSQLGKHVEAREMLRRARELDPLFPLMYANSAVVALQAGDPQSAVEFSRQAIAMNPEFWVGYLHLGGAQRDLGNYEAALDAYAEAERLSGRNLTKTAASRAYILAKLGRMDEVRDILAEMTERSAHQHVSAYSFAIVHAALGEDDLAFEWLDRALAAHDVDVTDLPTDSRLESLRSDPRFESLLIRCDCDPQSDGSP